MAGKSAGKRNSAVKPQNTTTTTTTNNNNNNRRQNLTQLIPLIASATTSAHTFLTQNDLHLLPSQTLSLESSLSSTTHSLSKLLSLLHHPIAFSLPRPPPSPPCWFHRFLSLPFPQYDNLWVESFRMTRPSFTLLLRLLTPSLSSLSPQISPNYALAAALFRLAHTASFKAVGRRFNLDSESACRVFYVVCKAVNDNLGHLFEFKSDINRIVVGFGWISLPNCCGVLGFDSFGVEGNLLGENGSVMVQALVDSEGRFLDVSAGWPSRMKPDLILRQSELFSRVEESRELLNGPSFELSDGSTIPQYLLGESCFPLLPWLLTPFEKLEDEDSENSNSPENVFNELHSRGMGLVNTAFGRLRENWKILSRELKEEWIQSFPYVVVTCCLLHNFLIKCSEELPDENSINYLRNHELPVYEGEVDESAQRIRNALALHLTRWD